MLLVTFRKRNSLQLLVTLSQESNKYYITIYFFLLKYNRGHLFGDENMFSTSSQIINVTGFWKTDPNRTFGISRITNLKYLTHCESLLLGCSHAIFAVATATIVI